MNGWLGLTGVRGTSTPCNMQSSAIFNLAASAFDEEITVDYWLYHPQVAVLHDIQQSLGKFVPSADRYLWEREGFELQLVNAPSGGGHSNGSKHGHVDAYGSWLKGVSRVGECIEDAWMIVQILFAISSAFPSVAIRFVS